MECGNILPEILPTESELFRDWRVKNPLTHGVHCGHRKNLLGLLHKKNDEHKEAINSMLPVMTRMDVKQ